MRQVAFAAVIGALLLSVGSARDDVSASYGSSESLSLSTGALPLAVSKTETYTEVEGVRALANSIAGGKAVTFGSYDWDPEPEDLGIAISGSTSASLVDDEAKVAVSALTGGSSFTLGEATALTDEDAQAYGFGYIRKNPLPRPLPCLKKHCD